MREGPCFTVFPALKHHLVQYRGSTNNEHLGFLDLFDVWSIITYVPNTNSSIAPCHYGENFSHLKWYPLSLPSTPHVSEVLVAQTRWLVLLGKRGARTVDANNEMCVTCLGENKFPWSMFRTQTVTPPPHPGSLRFGSTAHVSLSESQQVLEHFLPLLHLWPLDLLYEMCYHATWQEEGRFWGRAWHSQWAFRRDLGPIDQAADGGRPQDSLSSLPTRTFLLPWGPLFMCVREETET